MNTIAETATCPACSGHAAVPHCTRCEAWVVQLPPAAQVLTTNRERTLHWSARHRIVHEWRTTAGWVFRSMRLPKMQRIHVYVHWNAADGRRRDPANCAPTFKAAVDGLVDSGVIPDDDAAHLVGPDVRLGPIRRPATLTFAIVPLEPPR